MRRLSLKNILTIAALACMGFGVLGSVPQKAAAQNRVRAYIPPDQLVSFLPSTPFNRFTEYLNPIFERVAGKSIIDPDSRDHPIGISISGVHFLDALELVLGYNDLEYRETERYFMIQVAPPEDLILDADEAAGISRGVEAGEVTMPANLDTRQIQINAVLFELNHSLAKDTGIDWSVLFGSTGSTGGGGGEGGGAENQVSFVLKTDKLFDSLDDVLVAPDEMDFSNLNSLFRLAEASGAGETIASPSVTVQSGVLGDIQIGSDVPVQIRDNFGNISTQLFQTGIIIKVTPTLITEAVIDTVGAPTIEFIHLDVKVEKSGSRPSAAGPIIDRSMANTQLIMLDGEQVVIGGLYSTEETVSRRGIPLLKDLPKWFFGFRYIFGRTQRTVAQKELVISLEANVIDPIRERITRAREGDLLSQQRAAVQRALQNFNSDVAEETENRQLGEKNKKD